MSYTITVSTDEFDYIFKKYNNRILINGNEINTNISQIKDPYEKKECIDTYNSLLNDGKNKKYASVKASLFFAPYVEIGLAPPISLMDTIVMYLLGFEKITDLTCNIKIIITDCEVYTYKEKNKKIEKYEMITSGSSCISYDYTALLDILIKNSID